MLISNDCPICPAGTCRGYPHLWRRMRAEPVRWAKVHESVNAPECDAARAARLSAEFPPDPTDPRPCGCL